MYLAAAAGKVKLPNDAGAETEAVSAAVDAADPPVSGVGVAVEAAAVENEKDPGLKKRFG